MTRAGRRKPLRWVRLSRLRRSAARRWSVFILAFLALSIQNLVVQPHIHAQPSDTALTLEISDGEDGSAGNAPIEQAQTDCPMCQSSHQHGQYFRPSSVAFALPAFVHDRGIEFARIPAAHGRASHSWQGRAPPQA